MNIKTFALSVSTLALALVSIPMTSRAQGPLYDKVMVNLPYTVTIGDHVLQPGDYVIRQLPSDTGGDRVLLIYSDNGMKYQTDALTIPALKINTPEETQVVLHHIGPDYYFDKIWIQGKNYGYEFPLPPAVKAREKEMMQPLSVAATYQSVPEQAPQTAQAAPPAEQPAPAPAPQAEAPAPAPQAEAPAPAPAPQVAQVHRPHRLPKTADNWALMLLAGMLASAAGLFLRRKAWTV